jgi:Protein of unknown function (DUF4235)
MANKDKSKDDGEGKLGYKLMATLAAVLGALVARKSLAFVWKTATGKAPPANPEHPAVTWPEALTWAVVSGAVMGLARLVAQKKVAASWHKATGVLPPDMEETAA